MEYILGKNTLKNLETILQSGKPQSKILCNAVKDFIYDTPIDFCIIDNGGYRTAKMQKKLYDKGNSKCDGYLTESKHQSGLAVDLVPWLHNKATWDRDSCLYLAGAFMAYCKRMKLPVTGGADWNGDGYLKGDSWDPCHFEIKEI